MGDHFGNCLVVTYDFLAVLFNLSNTKLDLLHVFLNVIQLACELALVTITSASSFHTF